MNIQEFITNENHLFIEKLSGESFHDTRIAYEAKINEFSENFLGPTINVLTYPLLFPYQVFEDLSEAGKIIFSAKKKILKRLSKFLSPEEIVSFLALPSTLTRCINWEYLWQSPIEVARYDFLVDRSGGVKFCEMYFGSPVSGSATFEIAQIFSNIFQKTDFREFLSRAYFQQPDADLAKAINHRYVKHNCSRVVILDHSINWEYRGFTQYAYSTIHKLLPWLNTVIKNEKTWPDKWTEGDFLYRILNFEDIQNDLQYQNYLINRSDHIFTTFEGEILSSKVWFYILYNSEYTSELTDREIQTIQTYIPYTCPVNNDNIDLLIRDKDRYVFKDSWSSGGKGVLTGSTYSTDELKIHLSKSPAGAWIAQEYIASAQVPIFNSKTLSIEGMNAVFALFHVEGQASGLLLRAHPSNIIVNVTKGARIGWAIPFSGSMVV